MKTKKKPTTKLKKKTIKLKKTKKPVQKKKVLKGKVNKNLRKSINKKIKQVKKAIKPKAKVAKNERIQKVVKTKKLKNQRRKTRYTAKELEHFRKILLAERDKILENAKANMKALVDYESGEYVGDNLTYASHMAEQGTDEMEREKNYLFVQRDEKYLGYIQEALTRIDQGIYGVCIDCIEEPKNLCETCPLIPKERLELVPITQHCIECKNLRG